MPRRLASIRLPVTAILVFGSAGATLLAVGIALYLGFHGAIENTRTLLHQRAVQTIDGLIEDIGQDLAPIEHQVGWFAGRVAAGTIDPRDAADWERIMTALPAALPQATAIAFFASDGRGRLYVAGDEVVEVRDFAEFPRAERLIRESSRLLGPQWLPPVWSPRLEKAIIAAWIPLYRGEELLGVHVVVVALADFSNRLAARMRGSGLTPFVLYGRDALLAHPAIVGWHPGPDPVPSAARVGLFGREALTLLPDLNSFPGETVSRIWQARPIPLFADAGATAGETQVAQVQVGDATEIFVYRAVQRFGDRPWTIGAHFDADIVASEIDRLRHHGFLGFAVLLLAVGGAVVVGRLTAGPVRRLAAAAALAHRGELDAVPVLPPSPIREFDEAAASFNEMIQGMKERARIRDLFGKYLPEGVAARLLGAEETLAPQASVATILFVDIEKFTDLSETLEPQAIVDVLNEYFSTAVAIIERHRGVVTQFQGDAILAIFNVPLADPDHAQRAVSAAIEMYRAVASRRFAGHAIAFRIGINTGNVVAGNVGASKRLSYTVHGDAVNVAARLEALNKDYGTRILLSDATAGMLSGVPLRRIAEVTIRGRIGRLAVYAVPVEEIDLT